jgi:hypothetical protein
VTIDQGNKSNAGRPVEIENRTGGSVTFSGPITSKHSNTSGAGLGIRLNQNGIAAARTTIDFQDKIDLTTGPNAAFSATNGGLIKVANAASRLETGSARALTIDSSEIGSGGVTFDSISSGTASSTTPPGGILLNGTGNAGGLTVTGSASANPCSAANITGCTGGTIQNSADPNPGISLTNVGGGVSLTRMNVKSGADDGIRGTNVAGFSMSNSNVSSNGNNTENSERGFDFNNLSGTANFTAITANANREDGMRIGNTAGSVNATVNGGSWTNTIKNDGILIDIDGGTSHTVTVQNATFTQNHGDHYQVASDPTTPGTTVTSTVQGNTMTGNPAIENPADLSRSVGGGVTIGGTQLANITSTVSNNTILGSETSGIDHFPLSQTALIKATIENNTVNSPGSDGIKLEAAGDGTLRASVKNNNIGDATGHPSAYNFAGIEVFSKNTADIDATLQGNVVSDGHTVNSLNGLRAQVGRTGENDSATVCLDAGSTSTPALKNNFTGSSPAAGQFDMRLIQRGSNAALELPGLSPSPATATANINSYMTSRNIGDASSSADTISKVTSGTCTLP